METDASERLEGDVDKSLMIDGTSQFDVAEVSGIGFVVEVAEAGVVDSAVDRLARYIRLFLDVDCVGLVFVFGFEGGRERCNILETEGLEYMSHIFDANTTH